jgi:hypothetical protein
VPFINNMFKGVMSLFNNPGQMFFLKALAAAFLATSALALPSSLDQVHLEERQVKPNELCFNGNCFQDNTIKTLASFSPQSLQQQITALQVFLIQFVAKLIAFRLNWQSPLTRSRLSRPDKQPQRRSSHPAMLMVVCTPF